MEVSWGVGVVGKSAGLGRTDERYDAGTLVKSIVSLAQSVVSNVFRVGEIFPYYIVSTRR